jgi:hypothetical protein
MLATVTVSDKPFAIETKRFLFPARVETCCEECGHALCKDEYISYPAFNDTETVAFYCSHCEHETEVKLKLTIGVEVLP